MKVLIACEFSGIVRDAFIAKGHDVLSCDILPSERPGPHYQGNIADVLNYGWDLLIAHPPCTYLCNSGAKHLYLGGQKQNGPDPSRWENLREAAAFFSSLWNAPIPRIAVENPIMLRYAQTLIGNKPTQTVQPWWFGVPESKATCLWLKNLPPLKATKYIWRYNETTHRMAPGPDRARNRSRTFQGIADAMATQWG